MRQVPRFQYLSKMLMSYDSKLETNSSLIEIVANSHESLGVAMDRIAHFLPKATLRVNSTGRGAGMVVCCITVFHGYTVKRTDEDGATYIGNDDRDTLYRVLDGLFKTTDGRAYGASMM